MHKTVKSYRKKLLERNEKFSCHAAMQFFFSMKKSKIFYTKFKAKINEQKKEISKRTLVFQLSLHNLNLTKERNLNTVFRQTLLLCKSQ